MSCLKLCCSMTILIKVAINWNQLGLNYFIFRHTEWDIVGFSHYHHIPVQYTLYQH